MINAVPAEPDERSLAVDQGAGVFRQQLRLSKFERPRRRRMDEWGHLATVILNQEHLPGFRLGRKGA